MLRCLELAIESLVDACVALDVFHQQLVPTFATPGSQKLANDGRGRAGLALADLCYLELAKAADLCGHGSGFPAHGAGCSGCS